MRAAPRKVVVTLVALLSGAAATGCGQKGPLVLPDAQRPHRRVPVRPQASPVPPVSPTPATSAAPAAPSSPAAPADPPPAPR